VADIKEPSNTQDNALPAMPPLNSAFPAEAAPADTADTSYKPLSLWSLLGFSDAALYAVYMVVMAVSAIVMGKPALISLFTLLIPLVAIIVCILGRIQIALSENTLAGRDLTTWGIGLAVVVSLTYFAYNLAVYMALRNQAEEFAAEWLAELSREETAKAGLKVLPPTQQEALAPYKDKDPNWLNGEINARVGASEKDAPKNFMRLFKQSEVVRLLGEAGPDAKLEFRGVRSWEYVKNAYEVLLTFRVTTPDESSYDVLVMVRGLEAENDEYTGRRWQVDFRRSGMPRDPENPPIYSETSRKNTALAQSANVFVSNWTQKFATGYGTEAMLDQLSSAEREAGRTALKDEAAIGAFSGGGVMLLRPTPEGPLKKAEEQTATSFLSKEGKFFAEGNPRRKSAERLHTLLVTGGRDDAIRLEIDRVQPRRVLKGNSLQYHFDIRVTVLPSDMFTGVLVVATDAAVLNKPVGAPAEWQLIRLELQGAEAPQTGGPGAMPPPGQP